MKWTFYQLDKNIATDFYKQAYNWYQRTPNFLRAFSEFDDNEDQFILDLKKGLIFIGEVDGVFKGMVYGEPKTKDAVEGHLFCDLDSSEDFVVALVTFAKNESLVAYKYVVTHVLRRHKFLHKLMLRSGFIDTGMRSWSAVYKNSLLEGSYYCTA